MKLSLLALMVLGTAFANACLAADTEAVLPWRQDHPPNKALSPAEALSRFTVPDGFHVDLVASEPDIVNPIAMAFDDRGRIWITQSIEYPRKSGGPGRDRVMLIDGIDDAGHARAVSTFVDDLNIPTGIAYGYGGVWVLNSPDLLFFREKDGKPISREVVLSGFGRTDSHELPSSLTWGPDGWLYGLNGVFNESHVIAKDGKRHDFTAAMWRLHPRTREFQVFAQGTSNPYGITWDSEGSAIIEVCHWATDHLFHFVETGYYQQQAGIYPPFTMKIGSITDHGHQKTAYCGIARLDSDVFPPAWRDGICVGNLHGGCINVDRLHRDGSTYLSKELPDLMTANDVWFMPVCLKIGPDGCLYVLDWYDQYHCSQDAARDPGGVDRTKGRLYRLRYGNSPRAQHFDLAQESDQQLVERLSSPTSFFRESAQRVLAERLAMRADAGAKAKLQSALEGRITKGDVSREGRLQSLWTLIGGDALSTSLQLKLLSHPDPAFRAWTVRAAGNRGKIQPELRQAIVALAHDPSPDVQLQLAIAARKIDEVDALPVLIDILRTCGQDKLIPAIVWTNLHPLLETQSARLVELLKAPDPRRNNSRPLAPAVSILLPRMIDRILSAKAVDVRAVVSLVDYAIQNDPARASECIAAVAARTDGLNEKVLADLKLQLAPTIQAILKEQQPTPLRLSATLLATRLHMPSTDAAEVRRIFVSNAQPDDARLQALDALISFRDRSLLASLPEVLSASSPQFTSRVLQSLGRVEDPRLSDVILAQYPKLAPKIQPLAIDLIMQREPWARKLLDAVLAGKIPKGVLNANYLRKIMESDDREAIWAVEKAYGAVREERNPQREQVVAEMGKYLRQNIGNPIAGQQVFRNFCAQCHTIYGEGAKIGPDITANGRSSFDQLLSNVFDPSLVIGPGYQVVTVVTKDGRNLTGLFAEDNDQRVVLRLPGGGEEAIARNNVKYTRLSKLSMMPEGIEEILSRKDLCDLFAFLSLDKPPSDPTAAPIPGAPPIIKTPQPPNAEQRIKVEQKPQALLIRARARGTQQWVDLATYVMDPQLRPYLHPLRDASGQVVLTEDRPADHPWQHGIFTGFHQVNGFNYWKEDQGKQHFVRLLDLKESPDRVSWRALVELVAPDGKVVLEEEDAITIHAPESNDAYLIDFDLLLRAKDKEVHFGKYFVGGLSVRMPWDKNNPRQTHLNSEGLHGRDAEQKRAKWCSVERPFGDAVYGIAIFDHPTNPSHPPGWRVDEQGLINPNVSALADWSIPAGKDRAFRYRLLIYRGAANAAELARRFEDFAKQ